MRVYVLHFATIGSLSRAFDRLLSAERVGSCMIEPELFRLRFLAPGRLADVLVECIYQDGGLTWCSRHDLVDVDDADALTGGIPSRPF